MATDVEQVYQRAIRQFPGASWEDKLARWYLRQKRTEEFAQLTGQVVKIFSGTGLERYFREAVVSVDAQLYLQLNLYAHDRFPNDITFVKNLLSAYTRPGTSNGPAYARLLRAYWFYDDGLRGQFFSSLSRTGELAGELAATRAAQPDAAANPAAAAFLAAGEAWQSHFEAAAPWLRATSLSFPGDAGRARRASAVYRSLAAFDPKATEVATSLAVNMHRADPRSRELLAGIGDIYADRDLLSRAAPYWNRMPQTAPGTPDAYLDAATVFWDYYRYKDALRPLNEARTKFADPALYAYQEGAIYEGQHDYASAIREYIKGALAAPGSVDAKRLITLANRPGTRSFVDQASLQAISSSNPELAALRLRADVLDAQKRTADLQSFLTDTIRQNVSPETLSWIEGLAAAHHFAAVQELALKRQVQVTRDPVDKIRLRLALAAFYEGDHQTDVARHATDALYADHPAILGVVRAAVDFYWRNHLPAQAISTLTRAAAAANAEYRRQFTLEAARKATESGEYANARTLLAPLIEGDPYNAEYLAAMAQTWARADDDNGLRDFYTATIEALRQAPISPEERTSRIAAMRRGLIPALTRLRQYAPAVDQYIEIVNRYPEDEGLVHEAAVYAIEHQLQPQLLAYYTKTAASSPRDYRWPVVKARLETQFEDFSAAIAAYSRAVAIRPDRLDLFAARAVLEERLMRFEEAATTYRKLYELSYRDPQWLIKAAETNARLGKPDVAVETLREALLTGRPERPDILFDMARTLDSWGLVGRP